MGVFDHSKTIGAGPNPRKIPVFAPEAPKRPVLSSTISQEQKAGKRGEICQKKGNFMLFNPTLIIL